MFKKIFIASLLVAALAVPLAGIALAEQHTSENGDPCHRKGGKGMAGIVTNVDAASSEFSIENRAGETVTFMVNEDTEYLSPEGELESFEDLAEGMAVGVKAVGNDEGTLVAKAVKYIDPELFNAEHAGGEVTAVGADNFTITSREGEELTFQVDEDTRWGSRDGSLESLQDLVVGMHVGVAYQESDDGSLLALGVKKLMPRGEGRPGESDQRPEGAPRGDRAPSDRPRDQG